MTKAKLAELLNSINENFKAIMSGLQIANSNSAHMAEVIADANASITNINQDLEAQLQQIRIQVEERLVKLEEAVAMLQKEK